MSESRNKGSTGNSEFFRLVTASGTPLLGATIASMMLSYTRPLEAPVNSIMSALSSHGAAHAGFKAWEPFSGWTVLSNFAPGLYRVDGPDSAYATGRDKVILTVTHPLADPAMKEFALVDSLDPFAPASNAMALSSLQIRASSADIRVSSAAIQVGSNAVALSSLGTAIPSLMALNANSGITLQASAIAEAVSSLHTRVASAAAAIGSGASAANLALLTTQVSNQSVQIGSVDTRIASGFTALSSAGTQVNSIFSAVPSLMALNANSGITLQASGIAEAISSLNTRVGSVNIALNSMFTQLGSNDTRVSSIGIATNSAVTGVGSLVGITSAGRMAADVVTVNSDANAASNLRRGALATIVGQTTGDSTTSVLSASMTPAPTVSDQFLGRTGIFDRDTLTAQLRGQPFAVSSMPATGLLNVSTLTTAPPSGNTFTIT